eukprot:3299751-Karenia_brevis.AAC.1
MNHRLEHKIAWQVPEFTKLESKIMDVWFQNCTHGGRRDKWTLLRTNMPEMKSSRARCDQSHQHASLQVDLKTKKFPTAAEA